MKYHITITNNETGEALVDTDTCAIIGAVDREEKGTQLLVNFSADAVTVAATILGAIRAGNDALTKLPKKLARKVARESKKKI